MAFEKVEELEFIDYGVCPKYLEGECMYDEENWCLYRHPSDLSSGYRPSEDLKDFKVSGIRGQKCMRCLDKSVPCDKIGRASGKEDPCSECRHFGGENANCVLAADASHNDRLWKQMMGRCQKGYTLPAYKPRDAQPAATGTDAEDGTESESESGSEVSDHSVGYRGSDSENDDSSL